MPFLTPTVPDVDPVEFLKQPREERIRVLSAFWAEHGFGTPTMVPMIYIMKLIFLYVLGGLTVITLTSDVGALWEPSQWWNEAIVYQKAVVWTVLIEALGLGGSWGPLAGHFKPMTGGVLYWLRPGTIRLPPWPRVVPLTKGDGRTLGDVILYGLLLASLVLALVLPGVSISTIQLLEPALSGGMIPAWAVALPLALLVVVGLRDRTIFLAARGEQYAPALLASAALSFPDLIIAAKLVIVIIWIGASVSKWGHHFVHVVPPMVSNSPFVKSQKLKRLHYRNAPDDLRPSKFAWFMAHILGTTAELVVPLVLLFSHNRLLTLIAVGCMVAFHLFITSTFPLAVPLEWNILFGFLAILLFAGYPAQDGYSVLDFSQPWMLPVFAAALLFFPVLGNFRPDLVSFLPSMRQYAGNWAWATWAFAPGAEEKLNRLDRPAQNQIDQLIASGYDPVAAELTLEIPIAWHSMHTQGKGLISVLRRYLDSDYEKYALRVGEFGCNSVIGWNFGDGHLHDDQLIQAIQRRVGFEPGEFVIAWVESQPIHKKTQEFYVMDAALGIVQRGRWNVEDMVGVQPWLPDGPLPVEILSGSPVAATAQHDTNWASV